MLSLEIAKGRKMELFPLLHCVHHIREWCIKNRDEKNEFICGFEIIIYKSKLKKRPKMVYLFLPEPFLFQVKCPLKL